MPLKPVTQDDVHLQTTLESEIANDNDTYLFSPDPIDPRIVRRALFNLGVLGASEENQPAPPAPPDE